jgi:hypothetical protein
LQPGGQQALVLQGLRLSQPDNWPPNLAENFTMAMHFSLQADEISNILRRMTWS